MRFTIDCSTCLRNRSSSCQDCVVMFITNREANEAIVVDAEEFAALRRLSEAGLVPSLLHDEAEEATVAGAEVADPVDGTVLRGPGLRDVG